MKKAQCTLELTLSLLVVFILLAGAFALLFWSTRCLVNRHNTFLSNFPNTYNNPGEFYQPDRANLVPNDIAR